MNKVKILGFAGSLRQKSFNSGALRAAKILMPENAELEIFDLKDIPVFNQDNENDPPPAVKDFKQKIRAADAILIASPEYNYSISGVLKNAIDSATRPHGDNPFDGKPSAAFGASIGKLGTARGFYDLRKVADAVNMYLLNYPELLIAESAKKFDSEGNLTDQETKDRLQKLLLALVDWTLKLKQAGIAK